MPGLAFDKAVGTPPRRLSSSPVNPWSATRFNTLLQQPVWDHYQASAPITYSRYVLLQGFPSNASDKVVSAFLEPLTEPDSVRVCLTRRLRIDGSFVVAFYDTRSAANFVNLLHQSPAVFVSPSFVSREQVIKLAGISPFDKVLSDSEGPFKFTFLGPIVQVNQAQTWFASFGALADFRVSSQHWLGGHCWQTSFLVDWHDERCFKSASLWADHFRTPWSITYVKQMDTLPVKPLAQPRFTQLSLPTLDQLSLNNFEQEDDDSGIEFDLDIHKLAAYICSSPLFADFASSGTLGTPDATILAETECTTPLAQVKSVDAADEPNEEEADQNDDAVSSTSTVSSAVDSEDVASVDQTCPSPATSVHSEQQSPKQDVVSNKSSPPRVPLRLPKTENKLSPTKNFGIYREDSVPSANVIRTEALLRGKEKRTTLMIKNIPNRLSANDLMTFIDQSLGRRAYTFLYLRIDFTTRNNVGYAFVDFSTPRDVLDFCQARLGTRWDMYNSDKLVFACFAKVQGRQALVKHFRNSAIMEENAAFRPKLFAANGTEESWPKCDDDEQKARSQVNKVKVGLYPPQKDVIFKTAKLGSANTQKHRKR